MTKPIKRHEEQLPEASKASSIFKLSNINRPDEFYYTAYNSSLNKNHLENQFSNAIIQKKKKEKIRLNC